MAEFYEVGSGLAIPGLEAILEYGDASSMRSGRIPGAFRINDRSTLENVRLRQIDGLHGDPDGSDNRSPEADQDGELAGNMLYSGRTIGLTGDINAGSIPAVRDVATKFFGEFGKTERDLVIYPPNIVPQMTNLIKNPTFDADFGWVGLESSGAVSYIFQGSSTNGSYAAGHIGGLTVTDVGATSGFISFFPDEFEGLTRWSGEDIFLAARIRVFNITSPEVEIDSIALGLREYTVDDPEVYNLTQPTSVVDTYVNQPAPVDSQWYWLTLRVPSTSVSVLTRYVNLNVLAVWSANGDPLPGGTNAFSLSVDDVVFAFLDPADPTPTFYFGYDAPGYDFDGDPYRSSSSGPTYAVNLVPDPEMSSNSQVFGESLLLAEWLTHATGIAPSVQDPVIDPRWSGDYTSSVYCKLQKDNNATSRTMGFGPRGPQGTLSYFPAHPGRTLKFSLKANLYQKPAAGDVLVALTWLDTDGVIISTDSSTIAALGVSDHIVEGTAPATAFYVRPSISVTTTTANGVLEASLADVWLGDVTEAVVEPFFGVADYESPADPTQGVLARRRVIRPFLVRKARKTPGSPVGPETQADRNYKRTFTMSVRAGDPRVYVLDERRSLGTMGDTEPKLFQQFNDQYVTTETAGLPVPSGYTYEGHYITNPGSPGYKWSFEYLSNLDQVYGGRPVNGGGFGIKAWDYPAGGPLDFGTNTPAQDLKTRVYRSSEGNTYEEPYVILGGAPGGLADAHNSRQMRTAFTGSAGSRTFKYNDLTMLLKRVDASTWLELRWNGWSHYASSGWTPGTEPNAPYAFELWCSHDTGGSAATTRLATWDYSIQNKSNSNFDFPFVPLRDVRMLVAWIKDDVVYWQLWNRYPSLTDPSGVVEQGSYELPSGLQGVVGSSEAGHVGWSMRIGGGGSDTDFRFLARSSPFIHYFESYDVGIGPLTLGVPVIGTIDTPQKIQLRGDLLDPIVTITTPAYDGKPAASTVAHFTGLVSDASPITIDLSRNESVVDDLGQNRRDLVVPGSRFQKLRPGINYVSIQARSWSDLPVHVVTSWRDALR